MRSIICVKTGFVMKKIKVLAHPQSLLPPGCSLRLPDSWMLTRYLPRTGALARAGRAWARECSRHLRANINNKRANLSGTPPEPPSHPQQLRFVGGNPAAYFRLIWRWRKKNKTRRPGMWVSARWRRIHGEKQTFTQTSVLDLGESWRGLKGQRARGAAVKEVLYSSKYFSSYCFQGLEPLQGEGGCPLVASQFCCRHNKPSSYRIAVYMCGTCLCHARSM